MRQIEFPSRTKKPLLGNRLTGPTLDLIFGIIKAVFFLREQCVKKEFLYNRFYELTFDLVLQLYAENVAYSKFTRALSSDATKSVIESNPFEMNLEAWLDAYPTNQQRGKYSKPDYQETYALLTQYVRDGSGLPLEQFPKHHYLVNCMHIFHSMQKKIEHFCPETWKKIQEHIHENRMPYPSKKRQTEDYFTNSVHLANSIFTQGLHANKYSIWTPKRSFKTLRNVLKEHGPFICGPLKKYIRGIKKRDTHDVEKTQPDQIGKDLVLSPPAHETTPDKTSGAHDANRVFLINPYQPKNTIILTYTDFCQALDPLPFCQPQGSAYALHLDSEQANQTDNDKENKDLTLKPSK